MSARPRARGPRKAEAPAEAPGLAARRGALRLLSRVLDEGEIPSDATLAALAPAARAEARGLADVVFRRLGECDLALSGLVERRPDPPGLHVLRLMAAEILFAGTPPHAAVDSGVRLAQTTRGSERLAGLVNAVGRRLSADPPELEPAEAGPRNTPRWLRERLAADWGAETAAAVMAAHLAGAPHDLTMRSEGDAEALAAEAGGMVLPSGTVRLSGRPQLSTLPGYAEGAWWVQDAAAALPAAMLSVLPGERVLDICAAPGGKTMQLAAAGAAVTALDLSARRMERLAENLARTGLAAEAVVADALEWEPERPFDAILLDAPCSATGTIRRHPDLPHRFAPEGLEPLLELQARLLDRAWGWLAPGGRLVFATCSLLRAEGEEQAAAFLARTPGARLDPLAAGDPALPPGAVTAEGELRTLPSILPEIGGVDGFFACRIVRAG